MEERKIGSIEAVALVLTVAINHIILNLPKDIIQSTSSGSILNIIFISIVGLLIVYLITQLLKNFPGLDIFDISKFLGGKFLKIIIGILFICYLVFCVSMVVRSFSEFLKIAFFPRTPVAVIMLLFLIATVIVNKLGFQPMVRSTLFFMPAILFSIIFVFFANIEHFTIQRMFPLLGNGYSSVFFSGLSNLFAFGGISYLYLLPPHLKKQKDFAKIAFSSIGISAFFLLLSVLTLIFMFSLVASSEEIAPLYIATRIIEFGRFFQRLDAIFVFIWIISILSYLSIAIYFCTNIFKKITECQNQKWIVGLFCILCFGIGLLPKNLKQTSLLISNTYQYIILILVFGISIGLLVLANIKYIIKEKKKQKLAVKQ